MCVYILWLLQDVCVPVYLAGCVLCVCVYLCGCDHGVSGGGRWWSPQSGARSLWDLSRWPSGTEGWSGRKEASTSLLRFRRLTDDQTVQTLHELTPSIHGMSFWIPGEPAFTQNSEACVSKQHIEEQCAPTRLNKRVQEMHTAYVCEFLLCSQSKSNVQIAVKLWVIWFINSLATCHVDIPQTGETHGAATADAVSSGVLVLRGEICLNWIL